MENEIVTSYESEKQKFRLHATFQEIDTKIIPKTETKRKKIVKDQDSFEDIQKILTVIDGDHKWMKTWHK